MTQIIGIAMVRNDDIFLERSITNVVNFCDKIIILEGYSSDQTWSIVQKLTSQYDHITAHQIHSYLDSHAFISEYADSDTWVFGIDGDEVYDPIGLIDFKKDLLNGTYDNDWLLLGNVLHCNYWNQREGIARGYNGKSMTKLYNFNAIYAWPGRFERFHNKDRISFKPGYHGKLRRKLSVEYEWETSPFRCLHVCFMPRSSDSSLSTTRSGPGDSPLILRGLDRFRSISNIIGRLIHQRHSAYKVKYYQRGELIEVDTTSFT